MLSKIRVLQHSLSAKAALMDLTDCGEDAFTEGTVKDILEVAKENVRADLRRGVESQKQRRLQAEQSLREAQEIALGQRMRLRRIAASIARTVSIAAFVIAFLLLATGVVVTFPADLPSLLSAWARYAQPVLLLVVAALTIGNLVWGATLRQMADWLETEVSAAAEWVLFGVAGIPRD